MQCTIIVAVISPALVSKTAGRKIWVWCTNNYSPDLCARHTQGVDFIYDFIKSNGPYSNGRQSECMRCGHASGARVTMMGAHV